MEFLCATSGPHGFREIGSEKTNAYIIGGACGTTVIFLHSEGKETAISRPSDRAGGWAEFAIQGIVAPLRSAMQIELAWKGKHR